MVWGVKFEVRSAKCAECTVQIVNFPLALPFYKEVAKAVLVHDVKASSVVLRGRRGTSWHSHVSANGPKVILCGRRNTFASLSEDELHFLWQAQHFGDLHRHFAWQAQHLVQIRRVWNAILRGRRNISDTPHSTLYTLHFTLHTLHFTLYSPHSALHTLRFTPHTPHFTLYPPHSTLYTLHCTLHTLHFYSLNFTLYTLHSTLYTPHFALHTPHFPLYTLHFTLYTSHFSLYTPYSALHTLHSTLLCEPPSSVIGNHQKFQPFPSLIWVCPEIRYPKNPMVDGNFSCDNFGKCLWINHSLSFSISAQAVENIHTRV